MTQENWLAAIRRTLRPLRAACGGPLLLAACLEQGDRTVDTRAIFDEGTLCGRHCNHAATLGCSVPTDCADDCAAEGNGVNDACVRIWERVKLCELERAWGCDALGRLVDDECDETRQALRVCEAESAAPQCSSEQELHTCAQCCLDRFPSEWSAAVLGNRRCFCEVDHCGLEPGCDGYCRAIGDLNPACTTCVSYDLLRGCFADVRDTCESSLGCAGLMNCLELRCGFEAP